MYTPIQIGLPREFRDSIEYQEYLPCNISQSIVYCFWSLYSQQRLADDFQYLVLPDGCVDIIFDVSPAPTFTGALIMSSDITSTPLSLGNFFAYVGIRMQPGAWSQLPVEYIGQSVRRDNLGMQDLEQLRQLLARSTPSSSCLALENFALSLSKQSIISENKFVQDLLRNSPATVEDVIKTSGYSRRQVQRLIRDGTGYSPHDFLRIIRFQQALTFMKADGYADQSHFIRDFKRVTNMTPGEFKATYLF